MWPDSYWTKGYWQGSYWPPQEDNGVVRFLHALDEALAGHAESGEQLVIHILGRAALILRFGLNLATKDVDVVKGGDTPRLEALAFELFGAGTANARRLALHMEGVPPGLPPLPGTYRAQSIKLPGDWKVIRPMVLDVHHLAVTKLKRFHAGDREDLRILCDSGELSTNELARALDSAFQFGLDVEENPDHNRVQAHFKKLIAYLEGRSEAL